MMLALGMFVFMRQTLPHQTLQRDAEYRWPSNSRVGKRDSFQFLGPGEEKISLAGTLYPELTGGKLTMTAIRLMADQGAPGRYWMAPARFTVCTSSIISARQEACFLLTERRAKLILR